VSRASDAHGAGGIELVIFDLGRVLIRICDDWRHACEVARVPAPTTPLAPQVVARVNEIACRYDSGAIDLDQFARAVAAASGQRAADIVALQQAYLLGAYPGAAELVDELCRAGVRTACLSNTTDNHWRMMLDPSTPHFLPLARMTWRFASFQIGMRKPDERVYAHVERVTGVEPTRMVFFDDVEENIAAAARRGWRAHRIAIDADPIVQVRRQLHAHGIDVSKT
jgi:FMN phosphatase YigB (HAD superfamily)